MNPQDCYKQSRAKALSIGWLITREGEEAARAGFPLSANPYLENSVEAQHWLKGWRGSSRVHDPLAPLEGGASPEENLA